MFSNIAVVEMQPTTSLVKNSSKVFLKDRDEFRMMKASMMKLFEKIVNNFRKKLDLRSLCNAKVVSVPEKYL